MTDPADCHPSPEGPGSTIGSFGSTKCSTCKVLDYTRDYCDCLSE